MRFHALAATSVMLLAITSAASGAAPGFEANFAAAEANANTDQGALYDVALANALETDEVRAGIDACLLANPGAQAVHGYFEIRSTTAYSVVLMPAGAFSNCLAKALEGHAVPAPPKLPYLNPFTFTLPPQT